MRRRNDLYVRLAPLLRCPSCGAAAMTPVTRAFHCGACGHDAPEHNGWFDFLGGAAQSELSRPSLGQRLFLASLSARLYAAHRESPGMWLLTGHTFSDEARWLSDALAARSDGVVLDVPCGQGNFTAAIARRLRGGAVIGVDLSDRQLDLAARRLRHDRIDNVLLLRASALDLPLADGAMDAVSDCGGLHLYPDVPRAIGEMARVLEPGRAVAGLTFLGHRGIVDRLERAVAGPLGVRTFDFDELGAQFEAVGFERWRHHGRGLIGWFTASKARG